MLKQKLSVQVMYINYIVVNHEYFTHSKSEKINDNYWSQSSDSKYKYRLFLEELLIPVIDSYLPIERPS